MRLVLTIVLSLLSCQLVATIQTVTLDNGLQVIVKEDHRAPVAVSMIWYNIGSADEPGGISGVSHALEHMMFKGTSAHPSGDFSKKIAAIGGQENAFTSYDYTAYFEKIAAFQLPMSFKLEADRMQHLLLEAKEFTKEIDVIKEERRLRIDDNPRALALERYLASAHLAAPYHHPVIGWMDDLKQMTVHDLNVWYQNFYTPNNAVLVVVGDVDAPKVFNLARVYFGNIPKRPTFIRRPQIEPPSLGEKSLKVYTPASVPLLMFGYPVPSVKTAKKLWEPYALEIIAGILGASESSRFDKTLIRSNHLASNADVSYDLYARYSTQFIIYSTPTHLHRISELKVGLLQEIKKLQQDLVGDVELKRIKTQLIAQKIFEKDSIFGQAMELGLLQTIGLGWQSAADYPNHIKAITKEQIREVANRYFNDHAITDVQLFPQSLNKDPS
jgi:zinc protease